jgi:bifunctional enzyme CysN/CysC
VRRTAHAARLLSDAGVVTLVSLVSPYRIDRDNARAVHDEMSIDFLEVFVDTPLAECELRDPKGLYARARSGELKGFTGVDDPYEAPERPDLVLTPGELDEAVERAWALLVARGIIRP